MYLRKLIIQKCSITWLFVKIRVFPTFNRHGAGVPTISLSCHLWFIVFKSCLFPWCCLRLTLMFHNASVLLCQNLKCYDTVKRAAWWNLEPISYFRKLTLCWIVHVQEHVLSSCALTLCRVWDKRKLDLQGSFKTCYCQCPVWSQMSHMAGNAWKHKLMLKSTL